MNLRDEKGWLREAAIDSRRGQDNLYEKKGERYKMRAGLAKVNITPPVGLELSGWAFGPSVGILDELYAKVLLLENNGRKVAIITTDLIGFNTEYATAIREGIASKVNMNAGDVLISCSHTHSGPATMFLRRWGEINEDFVHVVEKQIIGAATIAAKGMQEARIGVGKGRADGVGINRRDREGGSVDPEVGVIRVDNSQGEMMAVLINYSCHPVAVHNYKNLISADFPGYAMGVIEKTKEGRVIALYTTGAAGDINPRQMHDVEYAEKFGNIIGGEALKVAEGIETRPELTLNVVSERVDLPVRKLPTADELKKRIAEGKEKLRKLKQEGTPAYHQLMGAYIPIEWAQEALDVVETGRTVDHLEMEIKVVRMNDAVLVAIPGEAFVDIGLNIRQTSPYPYTFVVEMANGTMGYLPTRKTFEQGGYEPEFAAKIYGTCLLTPNTQSIIEEGAERIIRRV